MFDRAASAVPDRQGYGFSINRDGDGALRRRLPPNLCELYRATASLIAGWNPALRAVVEQAGGSAAFPFGIFCARPADPGDEPAVTLPGDAIHTMTPGRGEGASTALRDAALLTTALSEAGAGRAGLAAAKRRYETEMLGYGFAAAANSTKPFFADAMRRRPRPSRGRRTGTSPDGNVAIAAA